MSMRRHDIIGAVILGVAAALFLNILIQSGLRPSRIRLSDEETTEAQRPDHKKDAGVALPQRQKEQRPAFMPRLELLGTILGNPSVAFIYDPETDRSGLYKPDDTINGIKVVSIDAGKILVEKDGSQCEILLSQKKTELAKENETGIVQDESGTMIISKFEVMAQMMQANEILSKVKILPLPDTGTNKLRGFRIDNVPSGSIIEAAGIKDGDIICSVQGQQLQSMQDALRMFNKVQNQPHIEVTLLRGDQPITLKYEIKN